LANPQAFSTRPNISLAFNHSVSGTTVTWSIKIYETSSQPTYSFYTNNNTLNYSIPGASRLTGSETSGSNVGFTFDFRDAGLQEITLAGGTYTATSSPVTAEASVVSNLLGTASVDQVITVNLTPAPATPAWSATSGAIRPRATRGVAYQSTVTASPVTSYTNVSQSANTRGLSATANVISGTPTSVGTVEFTIRANNSTATNSRTFSVVIDPAIPLFTDTTLATAIRDAPYSDEVVAEDTSNTGYNSTIQLPGFEIPGLTFNSDGTITGTPTTLGTYDFIVIATNDIGSTSADVSLTVARPVPVFEEEEDSEVSSPAIWGVSYTDGVLATDATNYAVDSGNFPTGLTLNALTGAITGTPTAVGSFTFVIRASNETGGVNTPSRTINVISPVRVNTATGPTASFVTGAVNVNTVTGPTGSFVPGAVSVWDGNTWVPAKLA
jgi:hypothetical protein